MMFEWLVFVFVIIETIQVFFLLRNNRKLKNLVEEILTNEEYAAKVATNMLFGFMDSVIDDDEKRETFFGFVGLCGINMVEAVKHHAGVNPDGSVDLAKIPKKYRGPLEIARMLGLDEIVKAKVKQGAKAKAAEVAESVAPGWG